MAAGASRDALRRASGALTALIVFSLALTTAACTTARSLQQTGIDAEAAYWCPMHPDVRGGHSDRCAICGMALVPASTADYRPYLLDVDVEPRALTAGQRGRLRFRVLDPRTRQPVTAFEPLHERVFHLFILGNDLEYFAHVHPEQRPDGFLELDVELPRPGPYRLIADFLPTGGAPQLVEKSIVTAGYTGSLAPQVSLTPQAGDNVVDGTRVSLIIPPPVAGREQLVTFELTDERTGKPVTDLEPYLGATGHLLVVSADLSVAFHSHPVAVITSQFGPTIVFQIVFPRAGMYRMWVQYQRQGKVGTASYSVQIRER